jgi:hypothetical protein
MTRITRGNELLGAVGFLDHPWLAGLYAADAIALSLRVKFARG